ARLQAGAQDRAEQLVCAQGYAVPDFAVRALAAHPKALSGYLVAAPEAAAKAASAERARLSSSAISRASGWMQRSSTSLRRASSAMCQSINRSRLNQASPRRSFS